LEYSKKELAEKSDLYFKFDEIKYGRRVGAIRFHIFNKELPSALLEKDEPPKVDLYDNKPEPFIAVDLTANPVIDDLLLLVTEKYRNLKSVLAGIIKYEREQGFEYVRRNILYTNSKAEKSYAGFFNNALKNDWGLDFQEHQVIKKPVPEVWERAGFNSAKEYDEFMYQKTMARYGKTIV
jgi:hypothetical protein